MARIRCCCGSCSLPHRLKRDSIFCIRGRCNPPGCARCKKKDSTFSTPLRPFHHRAHWNVHLSKRKKRRFLAPQCSVSLRGKHSCKGMRHGESSAGSHAWVIIDDPPLSSISSFCESSEDHGFELPYSIPKPGERHKQFERGRKVTSCIRSRLFCLNSKTTSASRS